MHRLVYATLASSGNLERSLLLLYDTSGQLFIFLRWSAQFLLQKSPTVQGSSIQMSWTSANFIGTTTSSFG
jgi:hypothetical protein